MPWRDVVGCFVGGFFLANFVPHYMAGMSGRPFHSPFAKPPFRGLSSPGVNVAWGLFNLAAAYFLLVVVGGFELHDLPHAAVAAAGFGLASFGVSGSVVRTQRALASAPKQAGPGG